MILRKSKRIADLETGRLSAERRISILKVRVVAQSARIAILERKLDDISKSGGKCMCESDPKR